MLILNSFSFEDKDPRFTRLKPGLALRLLSKGLFYIRAMACSILTDFEYEGHAMTGNGNRMKLLKHIQENFVKSHKMILIFGGF